MLPVEYLFLILKWRYKLLLFRGTNRINGFTRRRRRQQRMAFRLKRMPTEFCS